MSQHPKRQKSTLYFEEAVEKKGWWGAHRFLLLRRLCQLMIIVLFALPIAGVNSNLISQQGEASPTLTQSTYDDLANESDVRKSEVWILSGTLANSEVFGTIPLGDPLVFIQSTVAGNFYTLTGVMGVLMIALFYGFLGGRTYCAFVCPINIVTDAAVWIRRQLRLSNQISISKRARFYVLSMIIILSAIFQVIVWELINPITGLLRVLVFGGFAITNIAVVTVIMIFIVDIIGAANLWCGYLCPVGAFYGLLGKKTFLYMTAPNIQQCDDCMDCYKACPEPHVLKPMLQRKQTVIEFSDCTRCGRCLDVCPEKVFRYDLSSKPKVKVS